MQHLQHQAVLAGAAVWSSHRHHCKLFGSVACNCQQFRQLSSCSKLRTCSAAAQSGSADVSTQPKQCRHICSQCPTWPLKHSQQPCTNVALPLLHSLHRRSWHSLMTAPTTTAADAPGLSNLQGLLHVYKQSLANVGRDAVEQLRHTLAPSEDDDLHDEDTGKNTNWMSIAHVEGRSQDALHAWYLSLSCEKLPHNNQFTNRNSCLCYRS